MGARYAWRIDDVTPGMAWSRFWRFIDLFRRYRVAPLLGVVPDNRDPDLCREPDNPRFWERLTELRNQAAVEFAQHGHQHIDLRGSPRAATPDTPPSEFAGLPYPQQVAKVRMGQEALRAKGIDADVWMAPFHSWDRTTLRALVTCGFRFVSDGPGLYPTERDGLVFVPQQFWRPRHMPFGVFTICLHANSADERLYQSVEDFLKSGARSVRFTEAAAAARSSLRHAAANFAFEQGYRLLRRLKQVKSVPSAGREADRTVPPYR